MPRLILPILVLFGPVLWAAAPLKLELVGPAEKVGIDASSLEEAAALPELLRRQAAMLQQVDVDRKALQQVEKQLTAARAIKQGVGLMLRFTNTGTKPIELLYGPDVSQVHLTLEGPGAINLPFRGPTTMEFRMPEPTAIAPGASVEFAIAGLAYGHRDTSRWLISKPGAYKVVARFTTTLQEEHIELISNEVHFEVKAP